TSLLLFVCRTRLPPRSTPFPYTTLFRSHGRAGLAGAVILEVPIVVSVEDAWSVLSALPPARGAAAGYEGTAVLEDADDDTLTARSAEHTSELQSLTKLACRLLLDKKNHQ